MRVVEYTLEGIQEAEPMYRLATTVLDVVKERLRTGQCEFGFEVTVPIADMAKISADPLQLVGPGKKPIAEDETHCVE